MGKAPITHQLELQQFLEGIAEATQEELHSMQCQGISYSYTIMATLY